MQQQLSTRQRFILRVVVLVVVVLVLATFGVLKWNPPTLHSESSGPTERDGAAQVTQQPSRPPDLLTLAQPVVLAGPDVGFRVIRMEDQIPVGEIVVRINGAWIAPRTEK
jgi:hypothetical protein